MLPQMIGGEVVVVVVVGVVPPALVWPCCGLESSGEGETMLPI